MIRFNIIFFLEIKSINSYWENVYDKETDNQLENRYEIIFSYFIRKSIENLLNYLNAFKEYIKLNEIELNLNNSNLVQVNSFFQSDKFKGYVIQINNNNNLVYEAYFKPISNKHLINVDTNDSNNILLNSIVKLVIASDYDSRERRLDNYASILDVNSNPTILIQIDPINETLLLKIKWYNSNGI